MAASDRTTTNSDLLSYKSADDITPHDSTELTKNYAAFRLDSTGAAGTIKFTFDDATTLSVDAIMGETYQFTPKLVLATGTTATGIKGLV